MAEFKPRPPSNPSEIIARQIGAHKDNSGREVLPGGAEVRKPVFTTSGKVNKASSGLSRNKGVRSDGIGYARSSAGTKTPSNITPEHLKSKPNTGQIQDAPSLNYRPAWEFHDRPDAADLRHRSQVFKPRGQVKAEDFQNG